MEQSEFVHQAGGQLQKVDYANTPMPEILLLVPWRHQTIVDRVYDACKFACLHVCMQTCFVLCHADLFFVVLSRRFRRWRRFILLHAELFAQMPQIFPELSPCLPHTPWARSFCPLPFPSAGDRWFRVCGANLASVLYLSVRRSGGFQIISGW